MACEESARASVLRVRGVVDCSACQQVANAEPQKLDYCTPRANYADVCKHVGNAFAEKTNETVDATSVVQGLSKEATRLPHGVPVQIYFAFWGVRGSQVCCFCSGGLCC